MKKISLKLTEKGNMMCVDIIKKVNNGFELDETELAILDIGTHNLKPSEMDNISFKEMIVKCKNYLKANPTRKQLEKRGLK